MQDMRIGGLMRRVESCRLRLKEYCTGKKTKLKKRT
ncbi:MAG: hypothetical protein FWC80_01720 [Firmicutes bacterium]|nr:hypothetical protein [Bacillota bacterium]